MKIIKSHTVTAWRFGRLAITLPVQFQGDYLLVVWPFAWLPPRRG